MIDQRSKTSPFTADFELIFTPLVFFEATDKPLQLYNLQDELLMKNELFEIVYIKNFSQSEHETFYLPYI